MTYFENLIKSMNNWEEEIFNYFNSPITNAYTEYLNRLIKTMNHVRRGYSFEALRAKILFTQGYRKNKKKKIQRS
ncbi:transposase [Paraliobacillus sp. JSM ZJ581]|uniref:transposase n=1 Tax=Paraliobacillus sp. JSM ZJ581 TaxID=3342118 RepID=UPI0035A967BE